MAICKLRFVAATTRTFVWMDRLPPTRSNSCSCKTRNSAICVSIGSSPTSSRKIVPPSANSNRPTRRCTAPVKEPFSCPNNSEAIKSRGMAAQLTLTRAREERRDCRWIARAISSLPVPVSPVTKTVAVWSKISNVLKRLVFRSHNFLAQLDSETSRACTIRFDDQV